MKKIFITATNTNIGKTYTTIKLLNRFSKMGYRVGAFKPIETGVDTTPIDGVLLLETSKKLNPHFNSITVDDITPIQLKLPASPYVAKRDKQIDFNKIKKSYLKICQYCDIVLIEGAGGLLVPIEKDFYMVDLISYFNADALLVTHDRLGSINDTLLSLKLLKDRDIKHTWCINHRSNREDFKKITLPFYKDIYKTILSLDNIDKLAQQLLSN